MKTMKRQRLAAAALMFLPIALALAGHRSVSAQSSPASGDDCFNGYNYPPGTIPPGICPQLKQVQEQIDQIEQQTLQYAKSLPINAGTRLEQIRTLGKLELYDTKLSVNQNTACISCHTQETGFSGPISALNRTTVSYPGSVRYRFGSRKPKSYAYSAFSQVVHLDPGSQQLYGGNFWDQRVTGWQLQNPASQQAEEPPLDPLEMGFPDSACAVHRLSQSPYLFLFKKVWGINITAINWPSDTDKICSTPTAGPVDPNFPGPVKLDALSRSLSDTVYQQFAMSIVANEAGPDVSPFTSKFDYARNHPEKQVLTADEQAGWELFDGKGKCNMCHTDGMTSFQKGQPNVSFNEMAEAQPLFTNFTAFNLGLGKNDDIPFYFEDKPDQYNVTPNPQGTKFIDLGLGAFLTDASGVGVINPDNRWKKLAGTSLGRFLTPTIRDADKRPSPDFVKAYFHNGLAKSLRLVVHFYNTRDVLPTCPKHVNDKDIGKTCWPEPEVKANMNQDIGNLGLTDQEEQQIVDFMGTLTDGYTPQ